MGFVHQFSESHRVTFVPPVLQNPGKRGHARVFVDRMTRGRQHRILSRWIDLTEPVGNASKLLQKIRARYEPRQMPGVFALKFLRSDVGKVPVPSLICDSQMFRPADSVYR